MTKKKKTIELLLAIESINGGEKKAAGKMCGAGTGTTVELEDVVRVTTRSSSVVGIVN